MSKISKIIKKDGSTAPWNANKITNAVLKATMEVAKEDSDKPSDKSKKYAHDVSVMVEKEIIKKSAKGKVPTVEEVHDTVELCLYRTGKFEIAKSYILYRANQQKTHLKEHDNSLIQDYLTAAKYARYNKDYSRRETWDELTDRVKSMHLKHFANFDLYDDITNAFNAVKNKHVLPSMRSLQFGGEAIEVNNARLFNCSFTHIDRPRAFQEAMWLLLCGTGVGFSVQTHHVEKLPIIPNRAKEEELEVKFYTIPDSIEGWADALGELMASYIYGYLVEFDYSKIRDRGMSLKTSGGRAPGHVPLRKALENIRRVLDKAVGRKLRPIEAYDIVMYAAKAVLSGGIRRSATICLFSADDNEMMNAKTGNWFETNLQRSASNNSAVVIRDKTPKEVYDKLFESQKQFGEPGFYFSADPEYGTNPCCEIGLAPYVEITEENIQYFIDRKVECKIGDRLSGFQHCNLTTINASACKTKEDFFEACKVASFIGTIQASYTDMHYLGTATKYINEREALLGVSICGILDNPKICLDKDILREGAKLVLKENERVAKILGIEPAARTTCVKPEGTASLILNTSSGVHPHHAKHYFRRVQANRDEPVYQFYKLYNPDSCETGVYSPTDDVITFCITASNDAKLSDDLNAIDFLGIVKFVQENWVKVGTRHEKYHKNLYHNVSNTTAVENDEWEMVREYIWKNRHLFTGISLLTKTGDKEYPQAPREAVKTPADIAKWNSYTYEKVDYKKLIEEEDSTNLKEIIACAGGACEIS